MSVTSTTSCSLSHSMAFVLLMLTLRPSKVLWSRTDRWRRRARRKLWRRNGIRSGRLSNHFWRQWGDSWGRSGRILFCSSWARRSVLLFGHDDPLKLLHHLSEHIDCLGILLHAVRNHLRCSHHLLTKLADVLTAMLNGTDHSLNGGSELFHTALFVELSSRLVRLCVLVPLLCLYWLSFASVVRWMAVLVESWRI